MTEDVIYELKRLQRTLKTVQRTVKDSQNDVEKLIKKILPSKISKQQEEKEEQEENDLSLNSNEEIADYVNSLNSSNIIKANQTLNNSAASNVKGGNFGEISYIRQEHNRSVFDEDLHMRHGKRPRPEESDKFSKPLPVQKQQKSINNLNKISNSLCNSNLSLNKNSIQKFSAGIKVRKISHSPKRLNQSDSKFYEGINLMDASNNIESPHTRQKMNMFYSLTECFGRKSDSERKVKKIDFLTISNLTLFSLTHNIKVTNMKDTFPDKENSHPDHIDLCTAQIIILPDQEPKYVTGLVYKIEEVLNVPKKTNINDITYLELVPASAVAERPFVKYIFLLCDNLNTFVNYGKLSKEDMTQILTHTLINKKKYSSFPVLMWNAAIMELLAEFKTEDRRIRKKEMTQAFNSSLVGSNIGQNNTLCMLNQDNNNNLLSDGMVSHNQILKEEENYFQTNPGIFQKNNFMLSGNKNNRNLNNLNTAQITSGFSTNMERNLAFPMNHNNIIGSNIPNYNINNNFAAIQSENSHPNNNLENSRMGHVNQSHNQFNYSSNQIYGDMDY